MSLLAGLRKLTAMPASAKLASSLLIATAVAACAAPGAGAQSSYVTPKTGAWKVQDKFEITDGGGGTVAKKGTQLKNLKVTVGPESVEACGGEGSVKVTKTLTIKRVGSYKRPVVGRLSSKTQLIEPVSTKVSFNGGAPQDAQVEVLFDKTGKLAPTASLKFGDCNLQFALRR